MLPINWQAGVGNLKSRPKVFEEWFDHVPTCVPWQGSISLSHPLPMEVYPISFWMTPWRPIRFGTLEGKDISSSLFRREDSFFLLTGSYIAYVDQAAVDLRNPSLAWPVWDGQPSYPCF